MHIRTCAQPAASVFADVHVGVQKNSCVTYTPAHALMPKTPVPKCTQHLLQKNCTYIHIHTRAQPAASVFADVYVGVQNTPV